MAVIDDRNERAAKAHKRLGYKRFSAIEFPGYAKSLSVYALDLKKTSSGDEHKAPATAEHLSADLAALAIQSQKP